MMMMMTIVMRKGIEKVVRFKQFNQINASPLAENIFRVYEISRFVFVLSLRQPKDSITYCKLTGPPSR
jgi:hypothetical protein